LSDERISQLRRLPKDAASANDVLAIVDISASQTKKIQLDDLVAAGVDLIPVAEIDLDKLDQNSTTKLGTVAIASGAITAAKLGDDSSVAVQTTAPVADNFVGRGFFNDSTGNWQVFNGSEYQQVVMPSGGIGDLQVTTEKLADGAVTTAKVSPLGASAYATGSVSTAALADGGVTAVKIASGTITSEQIATGSITGVSLGSAVVTYDKLQNASQGDVLLGRISGSGTYEEIPLTAAGRELLADATAADQRESLGLGTLSTADGTWEDGSSFSGTSTGTNTGDQTITLTGDVAGTGTGSFATTIANDAITEVKVLDGAITENKIGAKAVAASKLGDNSGVVVATSVPIGDGAFVGQQWVNTNTGWEYTWTGSAWLRLQSVSDITFANSSPLTFSATLTDPFTAEITVGQTVQQATTVLAGPTAGEDAAPAYRALLPSDLPVATAEALGINRPGTGLAIADGTVNHSNAVSSGTLNGISFDNQGHITAAVPLVAADIPDLNASKITAGEFATERYADDSVTGEKLADYSTAKIGETLPVADYTGQIFFNPLQKNFFLWDGNVWQPIGISIGAIIFAGTYNASGNTVQSVTSEGSAIGLTVGSGLPAAAADNQNYYLVVSIGGVGVAPAPENQLDPPDLIISNGADWLEVDVSSTYVAQTAAQVGFVPAGEIGSTTVQAAIEEVSDECRNASNITAGTLAVARGGTNLSSYAKGDLIVASGATVLAKLGIGTDGQRLEADSTQPLGLKWATPASGTVTSVASTTAALVVASGTSTTAPSLSIASASTTASGVVMLTNSTSTTSSVLAATATAVKTVADVANGAMQASGSTATGPLRIGTTGSLLFEGSVDNGIRTTLTAANPTSARTVTLPNETGTVITSAGSGVVTSTMILDGTIVNADINASAAIDLSKLATGALPSGITVASANIVDGTIVNADISASAAIALSKLATGALPSGITVASTNIVDGTIVNADINASAAIALSKLATGALPPGITVASANIIDGTIVNADINASAAIADTKLATISTAGKVSNSATTATSANTASAIVARNASGDFAAGTITATLSGNATTATNCSRSVVAGNGLTGGGALSGNVTLNIGAGTGISVAASSIAVDSTVIRTTGTFIQNGQLTIRNGTDSGLLYFERTAAATNLKKWRLGADSDNTFSLVGLSDANEGSGYYFRFTRGGVNGNEVQTFQFMDGSSAWGSINNTTGRLALGVSTAAYRLDLPNTADVQGRGRSNQWVTYSDGRIKTDRKPIQYGLKTVMDMEPLQYFQHNSFSDEKGNLVILNEGDKSIGLVAEDVEKIIPEIVTAPADHAKDLYAIDYGKLTAVLVKAIQEQQSMIDNLEARIAAAGID
jgi:hypothetical protein